jgi:predicted nucleotidyltransferase
MLHNCSIFFVLKVFFLEPTKKHYLKEISLKSKLSHTSVKPILNKLKKEKIILEEQEKKGKRNFPIFFSDLNSENYKKYKKIFNLLEIYNLEFLKLIEDNLMPKSIVLFGSYSRGEDIETSDIDLFIESKKKEIDLNKFEKFFNRKINLHFSEKLANYPSELKNSIINGIVLRGYLT